MKVTVKKPIKPIKQDILKLLFKYEFQDGTSRTVAKEMGWSKSKVANEYKLCKSVGLTYEDAEKMSDEELRHLLRKDDGNDSHQIEIPPEYWESVCRQLHGRHRKTLKYIWTEQYSVEHPDGLGYSQFCRRYESWLSTAKMEVILPQDRIPGKEIFIDWIGDTISLLDTGSATMRNVYFFVSTIGDSSYPFVEAFLTMDQKNWNQAHIDMLEFYGGLPRVFVPDNTTTAVKKATLYDPQINHAYRALAEHYEVGIVPARVRTPQDKPSVEAGVKWLENWLLTYLEDNSTIYKDISEVNHDIKERMKKLVDKPFKSRAGSRKSVFDAIDKPMLRPLPKDSFEYFDTVIKKSLPNNFHFDIKETIVGNKKETFYYSFPYQYIGRPGYAHLYPKRVEIYAEGQGRIAVHKRIFSGDRYITIIDHGPENQKARLQFNQRTGAYYRAKALRFGKNTLTVISAILERGPVEEQGYKSCDGILRMGATYGDYAIEKACGRAIAAGRMNYTGVKFFLDATIKRDDPTTLVAPPSDTEHENLRDKWR